MKLENLATVYSDELTYISALFNQEEITFFNADLLINIDDAWRAISSYLWIDYNDDDIKEKKAPYQTIIINLAIAYYNNNQILHDNLKGVLTVTQMSQGSRSVTYRSKMVDIDSNGLTAEAKAALPPRKLRIL